MNEINEGSVVRRGRKPRDLTVSGILHETHEMEESDIVGEEFGEEEWKPASHLPSPPARAGYRQRWIRVEAMGQDDRQNFAKAFAEGWRPRSPESLPSGFYVPRINGGEHNGLLGVRGMVLCEIPESRARARERYYGDMSARQIHAVEKDLFKEERPGMPIHSERKTREISGRTPGIQDD